MRPSNFSHSLYLSHLSIYLKLLRAPFFTASIVPILVGTALAFAVGEVFNLPIFLLTLFAMMALHAGANIANDYFDHKSGNDLANENPTPFSGGSRVIQQGQISPASVLTASWVCLAMGIVLGMGLLLITKSAFVLILGIIGLLGGYFYTATPIKLGYRTAGELTIAFLFGLLPVYGAYYVQTMRFDLVPIVPGAIIAILIFLVILANEFADAEADRAVNKKTIVAAFGVIIAVRIYKIALMVLCLLSAINIFIIPNMLSQTVFLVILIVLSLGCIRFLNAEKLSGKGYAALSQAAILTHLIAGLTLAGSLLLSKII
jgi:1,4-dihydroxy-2-naphthoate polyprenyltransferase